MDFRRPALSCLVILSLVCASPARATAQSCSQVLQSLHDATANLNAEARRNGLNFLVDDTVGAGLRSAKAAMDASGDPTVAAYNQVRDAKERVDAWVARMNAFDDFFQRLVECGRTNCNMFEFIKRENLRDRLVESVRNQMNEWIQSLGDAGVSAAVDRVNKAASIVRETVSRAGNIATSGINGAASCMSQYMQAGPPPADAVNLRTPPASAAAPPAGSSGGSIGKLLGYSLVVVGGGVAGAYLLQQASIEDTVTTATTTSTPTTTTTTPVTNTPAQPANRPSTFGVGAFSCTVANGTSNFRSCTGTLNVTAGTLIAARQGATIAVQTAPSFFVGTFAAPALGGSTGTITLRATLASCPVQTSVNFSLPSAQPFESIAASIAVSCP